MSDQFVSYKFVPRIYVSKAVRGWNKIFSVMYCHSPLQSSANGVNMAEALTYSPSLNSLTKASQCTSEPPSHIRGEWTFM